MDHTAYIVSKKIDFFAECNDVLIHNSCCRGSHILLLTMNNEVITVGDTLSSSAKPRFLIKQEIGMDDTEQIVRAIA